MLTNVLDRVARFRYGSLAKESLDRLDVGIRDNGDL